MLDKLFENAARKQLTENALDIWRSKRMYEKAKKLGCITKYPNGREGLNIVKWHAHNMKRQAFMTLVIAPAAAIIGSTLGDMNSKN